MAFSTDTSRRIELPNSTIHFNTHPFARLRHFQKKYIFKMATSTSFHKKARVKSIPIIGTRPSLQNNQLLVSSGIPSLDNVIGGGLAVGTALLVEEDTYGNYSKMILKYFLAEGVMNKHEVLLSSADFPPDQILRELPGPLLDDPGQEAAPGDKEAMKIAWRYENQGQVQSTPSGFKFGHYYDLTKTMSAELLAQTKTSLHDVQEENSPCDCGKDEFMSPRYAKLLLQIRNIINQGGFRTGTGQQHKNILRIGLHSLGSPQWGEGVLDHNDHSLCRFLYALRGLLRGAYAVCAITMPTHLFENDVMPKRVQHLCDTVVKLESFVGSDKEKNPAFREYHGLFNIVKLPRLNSLNCHMPETLDLAFKLRRKKFMIEKLHLPPELSETASRDQEDPVAPKPGSAACGTGSGNSKLDF